MDTDVLVVGAGLAGAAAARTLSDAGRHVLALDKGRGPGGRLSTRRSESGTFDHGAGLLQTTTSAFSSWLLAEAAAGRAVPWGGGYVGKPGMNALVAGLLDGVDVRWSVAVAALRRLPERWRAMDSEGRVVGEAPSLVLAIPAVQAAALLTASALAPEVLPAGAISSLEEVRYAPCWAGLVRTDPDAGCAIQPMGGEGVIAALFREAEKPGRTNAGHWVLQATDAWSAANLEDDATGVAERLRAAFLARTGMDPRAVRDVSVHRWRYARPLTVLDPLPLEGEGFALAGDAFGSADSVLLPPAERAWLSGREAADRLLSAPQPKS